MNFETRLTQLLRNGRFLVSKSLQIREKNFTLALFFLFSGFLFGNIFGTFLVFIRKFVPWDGLIITITIFVMEIISYFRYHNKRNSIFNSKYRLIKPLSVSKLWKNLNYLKIGLMLGFFIDAFKVGS